MGGGGGGLIGRGGLVQTKSEVGIRGDNKDDVKFILFHILSIPVGNIVCQF